MNLLRTLAVIVLSGALAAPALAQQGYQTPPQAVTDMFLSGGPRDVIAISAYSQFWFPDIPLWLPALACVGVLLSLNLM